MISIEGKIDCIEGVPAWLASRLVAGQSWHPLAQGQVRAQCAARSMNEVREGVVAGQA
jgi:hypothetical protein